MGEAADVGAGVSQTSTVRRQRTHHQRPDPAALRCRVTLPDGRHASGELPVERHRAIQLWMLHRHTRGLVELTPGTRELEGRLYVDRRSRPEHYLPGGARGDKRWLVRLLEHAWAICDGKYARRFADGPREEVFVGVSERSEPRGAKDAVIQARWLWIDVDRPDRLEVLWEFLAERPCHLLVESAGSGGVHAYWQLAEALPAREGKREPIEQANLRIIHALGEDVADANCKERSRVLRLAGTVNFKTGRYARIMEANLALPPYDPARLVGDLADPPELAATEVAIRRREGRGEDPYKQIPAPAYFPLLAGITVPPRGGLVRCPAHDDEHPSCSVSPTEPVWKCHACGAGGTIYDLASAVLGGPTGTELRGEAFKRARAYIVDVLGEGAGR
jgi:CHC2 zinc finger